MHLGVAEGVLAVVGVGRPNVTVVVTGSDVAAVLGFPAVTVVVVIGTCVDVDSMSREMHAMDIARSIA